MKVTKCEFCDTYLSEVSEKVLVEEVTGELTYYCVYCFTQINPYVKDFIMINERF